MKYTTKYFSIEELVPKELLAGTSTTRRQILWWAFDNRALITLDRLRKKYGAMNVNTWMYGGNFQFRGWRPPDSTVGAKLSQHRFGRAFDTVFSNISVDEVRCDILSDPFDETYEFITCIEMDVNWLHFDVRNWNKKEDGLMKIYP